MLDDPLKIVMGKPPSRRKVKQGTVRHLSIPDLPACKFAGKRNLCDPALTLEVVALGCVECYDSLDL